MPFITTLHVDARGHSFDLAEEDDVLLFEAKVARGADFEFRIPGSNDPILIEINGLHTVKSADPAIE